VIYALAKRGTFAKRWHQGAIQPEEVSALSQLLIEEGAQAYTEEQASRFTREALVALDEASGANQSGAALRELAELLLNRRN
jgi:geranylgeranyl pyrophosphate synthase